MDNASRVIACSYSILERGAYLNVPRVRARIMK